MNMSFQDNLQCGSIKIGGRGFKSLTEPLSIQIFSIFPDKRILTRNLSIAHLPSLYSVPIKIGGRGLKSLIEPVSLQIFQPFPDKRILTRNLSSAHLPSLYSVGQNDADLPIDVNPYEYDMKHYYKILNSLDLERLHQFPHEVYNLQIKECYFLKMPDTLAPKISTVRELYIVCCSFKSFIAHGYPNSLRALIITRCIDLKFPPPHKFSLLNSLSITSSCESLLSFPLDLFPKLKSLHLQDCPNLASLSVSTTYVVCLTKLESIEIYDCPKLTSFPDTGLPTPNLFFLRLSNCGNLVKLPNFLDSLTQLNFLILDRCPNLKSFPTSLPSNLATLSIASCDKLIPKKEWGLRNLHTLHEFEIKGECLDLKIFPEEELLPTSLRRLHVSSLLSLEIVDKSLHDLTALRTLEIFSCPKLQSLSPQCVPSSLNSLCVRNCPQLTTKLLETARIYWDNMNHVDIDDTF